MCMEKYSLIEAVAGEIDFKNRLWVGPGYNFQV